MAISNFEFPKVTLEQHYANSPVATGTTLGVVCIGPRYILHRANKANEAALVPQTPTAYDPATGLELTSLPGHVPSAIPDTTDANTQHLYVKDGIFKYAAETESAGTLKVNSVTYTEVAFDSETATKWTAAGAAQANVYTSKANKPAIGGEVFTDAALENVYGVAVPATITVDSVVYTNDTSYAGTNVKWTNASDSLYTKADVTPVVGGAVYTDEACETASEDTISAVTEASVNAYTITEIALPAFNTDDGNITFNNYYVKSGNGYSAGEKFGTRGLMVGDPIILITSESKVPATILAIGSDVVDGGYNKITVGSGYAAVLAELTGVYFCEKKAVEYPRTDTTFEITQAAGEGGVTYGLRIRGGLSVTLDDINDVSAELQSGAMYIEYRERFSTKNISLGTLTTTAEIESNLGGICADNPLALACYFAMQGGSNTVVYYSTVSEDTAAAYTAVLDYLSKFSEVYSIVPCTTNESIIQACVASCVAYSNDINSKIRRVCWYGIDTNSALILWSGNGTWGTKADSTDRIVTINGTDIFIDHPLQKGDVLKKLYYPYDEYTIVATNGLNKATVTGANMPEDATVLALSLVRKAPTNSELIDDLIKQRSVRSTSERAMCVWADGVEYNGESVSNYAIAAAAAGMRAYEPCQRPLSNLGYGFFSLANTHGFTNSDLLRLGSNGVWIIGENSNGLPVNKRQITTAVANVLLLDEESIIANADTLAINLSRMGESYVGNSNITPVLLATLETDIDNYLSSCLINRTGNILIGAQLLGYSINNVWQDTVNLDHIYADIEVQPPRPFNRFHITMRVI